MPTLKSTGEQPTLLKPPVGRVVVQGRDFSYVISDLRRILALGASLVVAELALWYLFGHTGLGKSVYNLVNV